MKKRRRTLTNRFLAFVMALSLVAVTFYSDYTVAFANELETESETPAAGNEINEDQQQDVVEDVDLEDEDVDEEDEADVEGDEADVDEADEEDVDEDGDEAAEEDVDEDGDEADEEDGEEGDEADEEDGEEGDEADVDPEAEPAEAEENAEPAGEEQQNRILGVATEGEGEPEAEEEVPAEPQEFTVSYYVDGEFVGSEGVTENEGLSLPADPEKEGYRFSGWDVAEGTAVTADMSVNGSFELINYSVKYYDGDSLYADQEYNIEKGLTISFPEDPFKAGYFFMGWKDSENTVQSGSTVSTNMNLTADFQEIKIFEVKVEYYYVNPSSLEETVFDSAQILVEKHDLPATVESPADTAVSADIDPVNPIYYPTETSVQITSADAENIVGTRQDGAVVIGILAPKRVKYIPYEFNYYFTYMLKNLNGQGYTEVDRMEARGIAGVVVTPTVKEITGGVFESAPSVLVTTAGQELPVYYTRASYTLHFDTKGGEYVDAVTAPYETVINIRNTTPVYAGYAFAGWYKDSDLTQAAGNSVTLLKDTVLYAKWTPKKVNYTVVYQIENAGDDGYSYLGSVVQQEYVGTSVTWDASTANSKAPNSLDTDNFTFKDSSTETIKADGTTVVMVRYSRNVYTLKWDGRVYYTNGSNFTSSNKSASLTAKYGAIITQEWNTEFNDKVNHAHAWNFTTTNNDKFVSIETMPGKKYTKADGTVVTIVGSNNVITVHGYRLSDAGTQP